jgi:vacuolar-type H+-ATPase subunit I/STV1
MDADLNLSDPKGLALSTFVWFLLAVLYLTALIVLGLTSIRKGHTALFWFGIIFPVLWIAGALMAPTSAVTAAEARTELQ